MYNRYLWIRIALIHRLLHQIVEYIVSNSSYVSDNYLSFVFILFSFRKYYETYALVRNSVQGPILASLLGNNRFNFDVILFFK